MYSNYPVVENNRIGTVVTEDSNSGYQFFSGMFRERRVISAGGNSKVLDKIQEIGAEDILAIVDGAAFGSMVENCLEYFETRVNQRIAIWMPESFEYLILKSGVISSPELADILDSTADYVEAKNYESWEMYFTQLLISLTNDKAYKYSKKNLNEYYMQDRNVRKMTAIFPETIRKLFDKVY